MIAEPYICTKGKDTGRIEWFGMNPSELLDDVAFECWWRPYADFERGKLKELHEARGHKLIREVADKEKYLTFIETDDGYCLRLYESTFSAKSRKAETYYIS